MIRRRGVEEAIVQTHAESRGICGALKIARVLPGLGVTARRNTVSKVMKEPRIRAKGVCRWHPTTTDSSHGHAASPDVPDREGSHRRLDHRVETERGNLSIATMHLAKGLEFRAVAVMACDDEVIPLASRIAELGDDADFESIYDTERHLLYVACTRARDHLLVSGVEPGSEFVEDMGQVPRG